MRLKILAIAVLAASLLASVPLEAHHPFKAEFDDSKPVSLQGKVTKLEWINPHSWIHLDVEDPNGVVTSWLVECASPNFMTRAGLAKSELEVGAQLTIQAFPAKDGHRRAGATKIVLKNGQSFPVSTQSAISGSSIIFKGSNGPKGEK